MPPCAHIHQQYNPMQKHIVMCTKHSNQAWILVASDPVTSIKSPSLRNMCQPSKTTGAVHHLTCMQNSSYLPSHMNTHARHARIQIHAFTHFPSPWHAHSHTHTLTLVTHTYTHTNHTHMQKSNPVSVHLHAVTTSTNLAITKQMKSSGRISPAPACMYASEYASCLHTHAHYLDAFSLSSWLSGVQKTHSLIPALSLCLQHMRRQVLYLIHYSINWLLAAALTLPC